GMVAVVCLHSTVAYMTVRMQDLPWPIHDKSAAGFFDLVFIGIQGFAMPLFFLIAGFCAVRLAESGGIGGFMKNRLRRILVPFLAGCALVLPLIYFIWAYGWLRSGACEMAEILKVKFADPLLRRNCYGPAHLWFLEYLLIDCGIFAAARWVMSRWNFLRGPERLWGSAAAGRLFRSQWKVLFFAPLTAGIFYLSPGAMIGFKNSFLPDLFRLLHYLVFFTFGAWLNVFARDLRALSGGALRYLVLSAILLHPTACLVRVAVLNPLEGRSLVLFAFCAAFFCWFLVLGLLGLSLRYADRQSRAASHLAKASYWVYLVHLPVLGLLQIAVAEFVWSAAFKFAAVTAGTLALCLLSYRLVLGRGRPFEARLLCAILYLLFAGWLAIKGQSIYRQEKDRCRDVIGGFYRTYLRREPDPGGLEYWTGLAADKWGLRKVERIGFVDTKEI
ncbi:MAG: acyltransferase family protein, partial [Candidatus Omnitrophota bacterium]